MRKLKHVSKSPIDFIDEASNPLGRDDFGKKVREALARQPSRITVTAQQMQMLYEIVDDHVRTSSAVAGMKRVGTAADARRKQELIRRVQAGIKQLRKVVDDLRPDLRFPETILLGQTVSRRLERFERSLDQQFEPVVLDARITESLIRYLPQKTLRQDFIAELDEYVAHAFRKHLQAERDLVIGSVMGAARLFTAAEVKQDLVARIPMSRSRARKRQEQLRAGEVQFVRKWKPDDTSDSSHATGRIDRGNAK